MAYSDKELREIFHYRFLEELLKVSDPQIYILKGGVNLRFFLKSPRYSEDMDIDVTAGSVQTLKKNGYKILENPAMKRSLLSYGIADMLVNDPAKAKHTDTTQRFRIRLVSATGEEYPTKVEFSRRSQSDLFSNDPIDPEIAGRYRRISFGCQHYTGGSAALQKARALIGRPEPQARDVFDLHLLWLAGYITASFKLKKQDRERACENALSISYEQYRNQVEEYLDPAGLEDFRGRKNWSRMQERVVEALS